MTASIGRVVVLLGAPGAGKGTQAQVLSARLGLAHVATGDLFRAAVRDETPLGVTAKGFMDRGELVPDAVTIEMLLERLAQPDAQAGILLDGFPRNTAQAEVLSRALAEKGGVAREVAVEAMLNSVVASPVLGYRGPFILEGRMPEVPLADVNLQQKDMTLVLELARKMGVPAPLAAAANEMMNACRGLGIGHHDFVIAHEAYRRLGGMSK